MASLHVLTAIGAFEHIAFAIALASSINFSDSLTYTNPLEIMSGPAIIALFSFDNVTTTVNIPS